MPRPRKFKKSKLIVFRVEEEYYLLLKKRFPNLSEALRQAVELLLLQHNDQQVQIPNGAMAMGRNFNAGNITHVSNQTENSQNTNGEVLEFLDKLDYYNLLENLEWARKKLVKAYRKAYAYYKELEQMTQMESALDITPLKKHLSESINECNKYLNTIKKFSIQFIDKKYPMPEEAVNHIQQLYTLILELKSEAKKKKWLVEEIVYRDWGKKRKTTTIGAM